MTDLTIQQIIEHMPDAFVPASAAGVNAVVQLRFTGAEPGDWALAIKDNACTVQQGLDPKPQLTLTMNSQDFKDMVTGKLNGMMAFMQGKIKLSGDMSLAMKFTNMFKIG